MYNVEVLEVALFIGDTSFDLILEWNKGFNGALDYAQ